MATTKKREPFGGKKAAPFGKGGKRDEDEDKAKAKKAPVKKAAKRG
jgi:hypothetical protein